MGVNNGWAREFAQRLEAVGWQVSYTRSGHYKVRTGVGRGFTFGSTPSNRHSNTNALAEAKRHGLEKLEAQTLRRNEQDRQQRIQADRGSLAHALLTAAIESEERGGNPVAKDQILAQAGDLGEVGGVPIVDIAPAVIQTPVMSKPAPMKEASEVLLADGNVLYRCDKDREWPEHSGTLCHRTFDSARALLAHVTRHGKRKARGTTMNAKPNGEAKEVSDATRLRRLNAMPWAKAFIADMVRSGKLRQEQAKYATSYVPLHEVHSLYTAWAAEHKLPALPARSLGSLLAAAGWQRTHGGAHRRWYGWQAVPSTAHSAAQASQADLDLVARTIRLHSAAQADSGIVARTIRLAEGVGELRETLAVLTRGVQDAGKHIEEAAAELREIAEALPANLADEATLDKAQRWDNLKKSILD